jgi:pyruvate-formate lyase-activating enzyme
VANRFSGRGLTIDGLVLLSGGDALPVFESGAALLDLREGLEKNGREFKVPAVLFSGGEPLAQWLFVKAVMKYLEGVHTAVETSGVAGDDVFSDMMRTAGLVLMDIKHTDIKVHKEYTGSGNDAVLRHAIMLAGGATPFIIRVPLIPGVNDTEENMTATARLLQGSKALIRVELLPYHVTAGENRHVLSRFLRVFSARRV